VAVRGRLFVAVLAAFAAAPATALRPLEGSFSFDHGRDRDAAWSEGFFYSASGSSLQILDVRDPDGGYTPVARVQGAFTAVEVDGTRAVLTGPGGLTILDVSDPALPATLGALTLEGTPLDVKLEGTRAYVAVQPHGLRIVDVSNSAAPALLGSVELDPTLPGPADAAVASSGGFAYVLSPLGVDVVDAREPTAPRAIRRLDIASTQHGAEAEVRGGRLYVVGYDAAHGEGLHVFDLADPASPQFAAAIGSPERFFRFALDGDTLYADNGVDFQAFDVRDIARVEPLGVVLSPGNFAIGLQQTAELVVGAGRAYFVVMPLYGTPRALLREVSVEVPAFPKRTRRAAPVEAQPYEAIGSEGELLFGAEQGRFEVSSIASGLEPVLLGSAAIPGEAVDLAIAGTTAYVAASSQLAILDVANPGAPALLRTLDTRASAVKCAGDRLFVGTEDGGLEIYTISDRAHPALLGWMPAMLSAPADPPLPPTLDPFLIYDLELSGNVLFVVSLLGVRSVDVSDPSAPTSIGVLGLPATFYVSKLARSRSLLFLGGSNVVRVVDARNPARLRELSWLAAPGVEYLEAVGDRLMVGGYVIDVYDVSEPSAPRPMGGVVGGGEALQIADGIVYSGTPFLSPFNAIDFGPEFAPTPERAMDLNPFDPTNRVAITEPGAALVLLPGAPDFDATSVDLDSLRLGTGKAEPLAAFVRDWNRDGRPDAAAIFWVPDAGIQIVDTEICVAGNAKDGSTLRGCDAIHPVTGCGDGFAAALIVPLLLPLRRTFRASTAS
jgi:hypothetical protein